MHYLADRKDLRDTPRSLASESETSVEITLEIEFEDSLHADSPTHDHGGLLLESFAKRRPHDSVCGARVGTEHDGTRCVGLRDQALVVLVHG